VVSERVGFYRMKVDALGLSDNEVDGGVEKEERKEMKMRGIY